MALIAFGALIVSPWLVILAMLVVAVVAVVDVRAAAKPPSIVRTHPDVLARGVAGDFKVEASGVPPNRLRLRQPLGPDLSLLGQPSTDSGVGWGKVGVAGDQIGAKVVARRRGRHLLAPVVARCTGPLGLMQRDHYCGPATEVLTYPDMPAARRIARAVRSGRFLDDGRAVGALGIGTDFEHVRDYVPDDDIRQLNWAATDRVGRPMSNQYREDRDREVIVAVDAGRLMTAPVGDRTRLDAALDAFVALAAVADVVGDRIGVVVYDSKVRLDLRPRRGGARLVVNALFDLEPTMVDADHRRAFTVVAGRKRSLVVVLTDVMDPDAAANLIDALPVLTRRHAVLIAGVNDPDLVRMATGDPTGTVGRYQAAVAADLLRSRRKVVDQMASVGAVTVDAEPDELATRSVAAYLRLKSRARL